MTAERRLALREEAIMWHVRIAEGDADDWEAFVDWLDADPAHVAAYDEVEAADHEVGPAVLAACPSTSAGAAVAANDDGPASFARRRWLSVAVAAVLALGVIFGTGVLPRSEPYLVATAAGETRTVTLPSGDRIALNGDTRITLDRKNPRFASLERGEAAFTVKHDPSDPFVLHIGQDRIEDVGTVFNVLHEKGRTRVDVAEGAVLYNPDHEAVTVTRADLCTILGAAIRSCWARSIPPRWGHGAKGG